MKKYIEDIIEIVLEDVSCDHQEIDEHPRGPKYDDVTYCLNDEKKVIDKCIEAIPARLIERPEITEEFMEKKARELITMVSDLYPHEGSPCVIPKSKAKDFLCSLLNELAAKINLIGPQDCPYNEKKEVRVSKATRLIQSRCIHRRIGIMTEGGHKYFHCQDCGKPFPEKEI